MTVRDTFNGFSDEQLRKFYKLVRAMVCDSVEEMKEFDEDAVWAVDRSDFDHCNRRSVWFADFAAAELTKVFTKYHYQISPETIEFGSSLSADTFHTFDKTAYTNTRDSILASI